jgi:hypothetical protein
MKRSRNAVLCVAPWAWFILRISLLYPICSIDVSGATGDGMGA